MLDEELERASEGDDADFVAHMQDIAKRCEVFGPVKESDTMQSMFNDLEKMLEAEGGK